MQDEELDDMDELIREASKSYHPAYDDKSWEKMEALLDKHLPQKEEKKRPVIFFLLLLFLAGAGALVFLYWPGRHATKNIADKVVPSTNPAKGTGIAGKPADPHILASITGTRTDQSTKDIQSGNKKYAPGNPEKLLLPGYRPVKKDQPDNSGEGRGDRTIEKDEAITIEQTLPEKDQASTGYDKNPVAITSTRIDDHPANAIVQPVKNDTAATLVTKKATTSTLPATSPAKPGKKPADKKGFANNFAISLSAGPDISFVGLGENTKTRLSYGAGLSYTFLKGRVTLESGFYVANKIYSAQSGDYHPPSSYWTNTANLERVDADCKLYEIPLAASYNFSQSKNHSWFAGIGFSTFLMKRETYNYLYKDAWGRTQYKGWTLNNGENNYFSVLTISGGYQYRISRNLSIAAEPYLKLPMQGIGFGKIKLNSGGLLFTASIKPFGRKN